MIGFASAIGFSAAHLLPHWSAFSDAFTGAPPRAAVTAFSWFAAIFEIGAGLALGIAGLRALRGRTRHDDAPTRDRIRDSAADLFQHQGYHATGVKQIVHGASAQLASLYHFFPGGKEALGVEVVRVAGAGTRRWSRGVWDAAPDVVAGVHAVFDGAAAVLEATGYEDACPIATVALEVASTNETLRLATAEVFDAWIESATERLRRAGGIDRRDAPASSRSRSWVGSRGRSCWRGRPGRPSRCAPAGAVAADAVARALPA